MSITPDTTKRSEGYSHIFQNFDFRIPSTTVFEFNHPAETVTYSGIKYHFKLTRVGSFFLTNYIIPSIIFMLISYTGFWINRDAVPARVGLAIISILITISKQSSFYEFLPRIGYSTWMGEFFIGTLTFTTFSIIEFSIVNLALTNYNKMKATLQAKLKSLADMNKEQDEGI